MTRIHEYDWSKVNNDVKEKLLHGRVQTSVTGETYTMICRILPNTISVLNKMLEDVHWDINRQHTYAMGKYRDIANRNIAKLRKDKHVLMDIIESISAVDDRYPAYNSDMYVMKDDSGRVTVLNLNDAVKLFNIGGAKYEGNR